jgi:hypothetical protein
MESGPAAQSPRPEGLWTVLNRPRPIDPRTIQVLCGFHAGVYLLLTVLHHDPVHPGFDWVRGTIGLLGIVGMVLASRFDFAAARAFAIAMIVTTSLGVGVIGAVIGTTPLQLPLTALATFVITCFLQTGLDAAVVVPLLAIGHAIILAIWPPAPGALGLAAT